jgi:acetylornithine/succinyldiaminopimelate/putrescine aminotransferase
LLPITTPNPLQTGKALSGGMYPVSAVLADDEVGLVGFGTDGLPFSKSRLSSRPTTRQKPSFALALL